MWIHSSDTELGINATEPSILAMTTTLLTHVKEQFGEELYEKVIKLSRMTEEELTNEMLKELKDFLTKGEE